MMATPLTEPSLRITRGTAHFYLILQIYDHKSSNVLPFRIPNDFIFRVEIEGHIIVGDLDSAIGPCYGSDGAGYAGCAPYDWSSDTGGNRIRGPFGGARARAVAYACLVCFIQIERHAVRRRKICSEGGRTFRIQYNYTGGS